MRIDHGKWPLEENGEPSRKISSTRVWGFSSNNRIHLPIVAVFQWKIWENLRKSIPGSIVSGMMLWNLQATEFPTFWTSSAEYPGSVDVAMGLWNGWSCCVGETLELKITSRMAFFNTLFVRLELITCVDSRSWWKRWVTGYPLN